MRQNAVSLRLLLATVHTVDLAVSHAIATDLYIAACRTAYTATDRKTAPACCDSVAGVLPETASAAQVKLST